MSLATFVRVGRAERERAASPPTLANVSSDADTVQSGGVDFAHADIIHDLTILRVAAHEAFERAARRGIADLAHEVLARELALAPVDIEAMVARALAAFAQSEPIALGVSVADGARIRSPLPIRVDEALECGDLTVFVRDGAFESTFGFRLASALARAASPGTA